MIQGAARRKLAIELVVKFAESLQAAGCSAHRLEELLSQAAYALDLEGTQCMAMATGVVMSFGTEGPAQVVRGAMARHNLSRFTEITRLLYELTHEEGDVDPVAYLARLEEITSKPALYTSMQRVAAYGLAGLTFPILLGGFWRESVVGTLVGLLCGILVVQAESHHRLARMSELVTGLSCGVVAQLGALLCPCDPFIALLGGILFALPGVAFVLGLAELANRSVLSGTARMTFALVALVQVLIGGALGDRLFSMLITVPELPAVAPPLWVSFLTLPAAGVAVSVFMRSRVIDMPWVIACSSIAFIVTKLVVKQSGEDWLGSFAGAIAVGIFSNIYARRTRGPGIAMLVSGIYLLGPASLGLRGLAAIFTGDAVEGLKLGFQMAMRGVGLVVGLLAASLLVPPPPPATRRAGAARHLWHSDRL